MGRRRAFTREFKLEAVRLIRDRGVTAAQASRDLGVHENVLRKWVRDFEADPQQAFPGQGQMKPEQQEIERRLARNQQARSVGDVLQNDPTVRVTKGFGNFQELYLVRGFPVYSDDMTYNGLYGVLPRQFVAAELIASSMGLGYLLVESQNNGRVDRMFLTIILLGVFGKTTDALVGVLERYLLKRWG